MDPLAIYYRSGTPQYVSNSGIEKRNDQTGALDKARESSIQRAQFSSTTTSYVNAIGNRNCKTPDSAVNAVDLERAARAFSSWIFSEMETFAPINYSKVLAGIEILKKLTANDSENIKSALTYGTGGSPLNPDESEIHRIGMLNAFLKFEEVKRPLENSAELKDFYEKLCIAVEDLYALLKKGA